MTFSSLLIITRPVRYGRRHRLKTLINRLGHCVLSPGIPGIGGLRPVLYIACLLCAIAAQAQQSERFGPYELHYSVVNTTFLQPETAAAYNITRGKKRAILNLAVREHGKAAGAEASGAATLPLEMELEGKTWDLIQNQPLVFREIREGPAIYYIAEFKFIDEEWRFFEIDFTPKGATRSYRFKFSHQVYIN